MQATPHDVLVARLTVPLGGRFALAGLIAEAAPTDDDEAIAAAARAAQDAETAVVVVGLTAEQETEAVDKSTLALPGRQDELVAAVAAAARRTIVVVNAATPVLMPWMDRVDSMLWVGLPGQEGGHAVADVLLGRAEPTGRLVTTFPVADGQGPAWSVTPVDGALAYTEGTRMGYRGWESGSGDSGVLVRRGAGLGPLGVRGPGVRGRRRGRDRHSAGHQHRRPTGPRGGAGLLAAGGRRRSGPPGRLRGGRRGRAGRGALGHGDAATPGPSGSGTPMPPPGRARPAAPCCWPAASATYASRCRGADPARTRLRPPRPETGRAQ